MPKPTENVEIIKFYFKITFCNLLKVLNKAFHRLYLAIFQLALVSLPPPNRHTISRKPGKKEFDVSLKNTTGIVAAGNPPEAV